MPKLAPKRVTGQCWLEIATEIVQGTEAIYGRKKYRPSELATSPADRRTSPQLRLHGTARFNSARKFCTRINDSALPPPVDPGPTCSMMKRLSSGETSYKTFSEVEK